ncbi:hypothetical protein Tco_1045368 [Tanacetum coccineum]|uniref:Reverse transcriptase domain-containing protein n=1 Tax=Tanacetum coccineum TaxID=301880 RepID=A0ABQ5GSJ2_9ASTR
MGGQNGRGGGRTGDQVGQGNGANGGVDEVPDFSTIIAQQLQGPLPIIVAQVGDHISNQGINGSRNDNAANDSIHEDVRNVNMSNGQSGCSYKEFMACKPKEFDVYTDRFHKLARLVPHLVTPETKRIERYIYGLAPHIRKMVAATEPPTIQNVIQKAKVLTDEAARNLDKIKDKLRDKVEDQVPEFIDVPNTDSKNLRNQLFSMQFQMAGKLHPSKPDIRGKIIHKPVNRDGKNHVGVYIGLPQLTCTYEYSSTGEPHNM